MRFGVQQHAGTSSIPFQSSSLTRLLGAAGRGREELRTCSSASLSPSSPQCCPRAGIPVPSRPVPPRPAADASLPSPAQLPSSERTPGPAGPAPQPRHEGPPARSHVLPARRHPGLIPLIGFISVGMGSAVLYLLRLALYSPDVSWDRKNNPEPWNKLSPTDQYKFLAVSTDYKSLKKERPSF